MLNEFCHRHSPCMFINRRGLCVNSRGMHTKGHQDSRGRILAAGPYTSNFTYELYRYEWREILQKDIALLQKELKDDMAVYKTPDEDAILELHSDYMTHFYKTTKQTELFRSHDACVCCFTQISQHALPCGHVLCTPCVKGYGSCGDKFVFTLDCCPLHPRKTRWPNPFVIRFKPEFAGVRVLCLDG
jgi:hypothetical protein